MEQGDDFDEKGRFLPDPQPLELPVGYNQPPAFLEEVRRFIRNELSLVANRNQAETFEEADDFDLPDDFPRSIHELEPMQEEEPPAKVRAEKVKRDKEEQAREAGRKKPEGNGDDVPVTAKKKAPVKNEEGKTDSPSKGAVKGSDED